MAFFVLRPPLRPTCGPRLARHVLALPGSGETFDRRNRRATSPGPWSNRPGGADATFPRQAFLSIHLLAQTLPPIKLSELEGALDRTLAPARVTNK